MGTLRARLIAGFRPPADLRDCDRYVRNLALGAMMLAFLFLPTSLVRTADLLFAGQGELVTYGTLAFFYLALALDSLLVFATRKSRVASRP